MKPIDKNIFYVQNIKQGTYQLAVAVDVKNDSFLYGAILEKVRIEKDTVEIKVKLAQMRQYFLSSNEE